MTQPTQPPPGYFAPIHASLWRAKTIFGVPQEFAVLSVTFWGALLLGLKAWIAAPLGFVLSWIPAIMLGRSDPHFLAVLRQHFLHRDFRRG